MHLSQANLDQTGIFLIGMFGINVRGIQTPNAMVGVLLFFGGASQFLAGIIEFLRGQVVRNP